MTRNNLFTMLNKLCNEMDSEYKTSYGGCCFVTACLAKNLEISNIPFTIIRVTNPCHYFIKVSDRYINRCDFRIDKEFMEILNFYDSKDLFNIYYNETWNDYYNRKWNLIVSTKINSLFKKYENSRT